MAEQVPSELIRQLLELPYEQRGQVAETLINSLHPPGDDVAADQWREAWTAECFDRMAEVERGDARPIPADELLQQLREKHGDEAESR